MRLPTWIGKTSVIICAGPSLSDEQLAAVGPHGEVKVIAVNTAYMYAPWADVVYGSDYMFWKVHGARVKAQAPHAQRWTTDTSAAERYQLHRERGGNRDGLGTSVVHINGNSGFAAINLAYLWGSRRILLLGMDMREIDGKKHRHGDHEKPLTQAQLFEEWLHKSAKLAEDLKREGCAMINCTPGSALTCFPVSTIEKELACN